MWNKKIITLLMLSAVLNSCMTTGANTANDDSEDEIAATDDTSSSDSGESLEDDLLNPDNESEADASVETSEDVAQQSDTIDEQIDNELDQATDAPADQVAAEEPPAPDISSDSNMDVESASGTDAMAATTDSGSENLSVQSSGEKATVTKLDFLGNENGGTIVINTTGPVEYTSRTNPENKQFIVELKNTVLPKKFQRPYNTNEFKGAIGLFQGYQNPNGNVARFVIQTAGDAEPLVQQEGSSLMIVASGAGGAVNPDAAATAATEPAPAPEAQAMATMENSFEPAVDEGAAKEDAEALQNKSIEDFLTGNSKFYGRKINIIVKDTDIRDVFDFVAEQSGLNLVLAEEVKGKISLNLRQIPWDQALIVIMQTKQLGYKRNGNIIRIAPLNDLRAESDSARQVIESQRLLQPTQVKIIPVSYAKAIDLEAQAKDFISTTRGKVKADTRTNSLVVTDIPENLDRIAKLIKSLDTQTPQVLIEAKIVEAKENFSQQVGINWNAGKNNGVAHADFGATLNPAQVLSSQLTFGSLGNDVMATLNLLEQEEMIKIISSPRVTGMNNLTSHIEQSTDIPIVKSDNVNGTITKTVTYIPVKLELDVTPQVTADGSVIMGLKLSREIAGAPDDTGGRPIYKRNANTTVIVNNGDTAVIGGIYSSDVTNGTNGIPYLSKIPIVGWFFKAKSESIEKNELMMFVTPRILNLDRAFAGGEDSSDKIIDEQNQFL